MWGRKNVRKKKVIQLRREREHFGKRWNTRERERKKRETSKEICDKILISSWMMGDVIGCPVKAWKKKDERKEELATGNVENRGKKKRERERERERERGRERGSRVPEGQLATSQTRLFQTPQTPNASRFRKKHTHSATQWTPPWSSLAVVRERERERRERERNRERERKRERLLEGTSECKEEKEKVGRGEGGRNTERKRGTERERERERERGYLRRSDGRTVLIEHNAIDVFHTNLRSLCK
jgi:hypothetical protein